MRQAAWHHTSKLSICRSQTPVAGEIRVHLHANSLNFHDDPWSAAPIRRTWAASRWPTAPGLSRRWATASQTLGSATMSCPLSFQRGWMGGWAARGGRFLHGVRRRCGRLRARCRGAARELVHEGATRLQPCRGGDVDNRWAHCPAVSSPGPRLITLASPNSCGGGLPVSMRPSATA